MYTGFNIGGFLSQAKEFSKEHLDTFITKKDFSNIKNWGFNIIRLPVDYFLFEREPFIYDERMIQYIDKCINWAEELDLFLILDLHKAPGHSFAYKERDKNDIWKKDSESRKRFLKIWNFFSFRYKDKKNIMYEILNEPVAENDNIWNELSEDAIKEIRKNDSSHYIVVESNKWGTPRTFINLKKFDDEKVIYSFHFYDPILVTHQLAEWTSFYIHNIYRKKVKYPGSPEDIKDVKERLEKKDKEFTTFLIDQDKFWDKKELEKALQPVIEFKEKYKVEILCGEFGCNVKADPDTRHNWTRDVVDIFKKHKISYTYWSYKNMDFGIYDFTEKYKDNPNYNNNRLDEKILEILKSGIF